MICAPLADRNEPTFGRRPLKPNAQFCFDQLHLLTHFFLIKAGE
jgi:hypothetical protein